MLVNLSQYITEYAGLLLLPGSVLLVVAGLVQWALGMRFLRSTAGFVGALAGLLAAMVLAEGQMLYMVGVPVVCGILAAFLSKPIYIFSTVLLIGAVVFFVLTEPAKGVFESSPNQSQPQQSSDLVVRVRDVAHKVGQTMTNYVAFFKKPPKRAMGISLVVVGVGLLIGMIWPRFYIATVCSGVGTCLLAAGLASSMKIKGQDVGGMIADNKWLMVAVAVGVWLLGVCINMKLNPKKQKAKSKQDLAKAILEGNKE